MTTVIELSPGKQVTISSDKGVLWLQIFSNQGSLGLQLSEKQALEVSTALAAGVLANRKRGAD